MSREVFCSKCKNRLFITHKKNDAMWQKPNGGSAIVPGGRCYHVPCESVYDLDEGLNVEIRNIGVGSKAVVEKVKNDVDLVLKETETVVLKKGDNAK